MKRQKIVALVGRPNVGKSTLFNRLSKKNKAIVHNIAGVTRDRKYGEAQLGPLSFLVIDTPGLEEAEEGKLEHRMMLQTQSAIEEADLVCLIVDYIDGITPIDKFFANFIRKQHNKKFILIVNKVEKSFSHDKAYYSLGFGDPIAISAQHGQGLADLYDAIVSLAQDAQDDEIEQLIDDPNKSSTPQIVVVGRPNSGKSTFINSILGQERLLTGPEAGITRESIALDINHEGNPIKLIDTAGLRKKSNVTKQLEKISNIDAINSIKFANTVILMLDSTIALQHQDLTIANYVIQEGRSLIIAINKWDLIPDADKGEYQKHLEYRLNHILPQVDGIFVVYLSAIQQIGIKQVLDQCLKSYDLWNKKISTSKLNDWLQFALDEHPLPIHKKLGRKVRIKYVTQVVSRPPTFKFFTNDPKAVSESYRKYLMNSIRMHFNMPGVPIRMNFAKSHNPYANRK